MKKSIDFVKEAAQTSNDFELTNTDLKRQYIVSNIIMYNAIVGLIKESKGSFGTGYPFYVLDKDLKGALPVINEQLRYNNELISEAEKSNYRDWRCALCLSEDGKLMPDLKTICKRCPNIEDALKPRKVINRLPDLDMWMVCDGKDIEAASKDLQKGLLLNGFKTSDVDPVKTIEDLQEIVTALKSGAMPDKKLPIDTHIIDTVSLYTLISKIPDVLDYSFRKGEIPYLPIHPISLRRSWHQDDTAYNFVHDYLSSFTEFEMDEKIQKVLNETRLEVAEKYSFDQLYDFLIKTGPDSVARRHETPELKESFERRMESWLER